MIYLALSLCLLSFLGMGLMLYGAYLLAREWRSFVKRAVARLKELEERADWNRTATNALTRRSQYCVDALGPVWETGNGTKIQMRLMTDTHIDQSIAWCRENGADHTELRKERNRRARNIRMALTAIPLAAPTATATTFGANILNREAIDELIGDLQKNQVGPEYLVSEGEIATVAQQLNWMLSEIERLRASTGS